MPSIQTAIQARPTHRYLTVDGDTTYDVIAINGVPQIDGPDDCIADQLAKIYRDAESTDAINRNAVASYLSLEVIH